MVCSGAYADAPRWPMARTGASPFALRFAAARTGVIRAGDVGSTLGPVLHAVVMAQRMSAAELRIAIVFMKRISRSETFSRNGRREDRVVVQELDARLVTRRSRVARGPATERSRRYYCTRGAP